MKSCRTVQELIEKARDEQLPTLIQTALDSHLSTCPGCARLSVMESALTEGLAALRSGDEHLELPSDFRRQVKERLLASDRSSHSPPRPWASGFRAGLAAAACLVIVAATIFALRGNSTGETPARVAATGPAAALGTASPAPFGQLADFDTRTAPLLYATPEVEVLYDEARRDRSDSVTLKAAADAETETDPESGRREYHF